MPRNALLLDSGLRVSQLATKTPSILPRRQSDDTNYMQIS